MAATYTPIASITLGATATSVTFSSIPSTYTDLVLIVSADATSGGQNLYLSFNSDTSTTYSRTFLYGNGSSAVSARNTLQPAIPLSEFGGANSGSYSIANIMNYANTTTYKTVIHRGGLAGNISAVTAGLWPSTAAITSLNCSPTGQPNTWVVGSTFNLYGILGANA
jgi:hypothetical protein